MLILTIDSTSYLPRVALVRDQTPLREISQTQNTIVWDDFRVGNGKYILAEYEFQLEKLWEET